MTQQPPPPPGQQPPYVGPPRRQRPRARWFWVGGALLVLAPLVFVGALFSVLRPLMAEDAVFSAENGSVQVGLPAGEERALFSDNGRSADCAVVDGSGASVELRRVSGEFTFNEWTAVSRFDTGDGDLTFTCEGLSPGSQLRIGQLPSTGVFVAGIVIGIVVPLILGLTGLVMLLVVTILYATGAPRRPKDAPA